MKTITNDDVAFFDVDQTLVLAIDTPVNPSNKKVAVYDSLTEKFITLYIHEPMVRILREQKRRGSIVIVWSRGGYEWAKNVVNALDLEGCVDYVMSKPKVYFDDLPVKKWLKDRVYLDPKSNYKKSL